MKDYPPLPDGLPRVLSASSALTACPDSVCPVLDAPELEELNGSSRLLDRRTAPAACPSAMRTTNPGASGISLPAMRSRALSSAVWVPACCWQTVSPRLPKPVPPFWADGQTGLPVMICVELDDEGETPEGVPFASILASVQHLGVAAVGFRCSGDRIDTLSILGQHAAFAAVPLMPVLRSRGRSPEEIQVHAMQALRAGGDLFLLGNSIDDAQLAAAEEALADFRPTDRVIEQDRETLFMACEAGGLLSPAGRALLL